MSTSSAHAKIAILGAGSIGCYLGGALHANGTPVALIGRARMAEKLRGSGLKLSDWRGNAHSVAAKDLNFHTEPNVLADAELVLVCVKSADTPAAAETLREHARPDAMVISFQNGIGNADTLKAINPAMTILSGMVPFNVVPTSDGRLHRGTEGELMVEAHSALQTWSSAFERAGLPLLQQTDFQSVQWGKLLLNLNNAVNALSDLPLKTQLSQRAYRQCLALLIEEAVQVLRAANIRPAKLSRVAPSALPFVLRLPDFLFVRLAKAMLHIDPEARSSMWEDLHLGRKTEVDYLNGAVVRLAESVGMDAPINRRMMELVHIVENGQAKAMNGPGLKGSLLASSAK